MADQELSLKITLENGEFKVSAGEVEQSIKKIPKAAEEASSGFNALNKAVVGVQTAFKAFMALEIVRLVVDLGKSLLTAADKAEKTKIAFQTITGSAELAQSAIQKLKDWTDKTPFTFTGVQEAAKQLLVFGTSQDELIPRLEMLGNLAGDNQAKFEGLANQYARASALGRVGFRELRPMIQEQIPIIDALAHSMGVSNAQIVKMAQQGRISFKDLDLALKSLTTGTGAYAGLLAKYADDLDTKWKVFKETIQRAFAGAGGIAEQPFKDLLQLGIDLEKQFGIFSGILKIVAGAIGLIAAMVSTLVTGTIALANGLNYLYNKSKQLTSFGDEAKYFEKQAQVYKKIFDQYGDKFLGSIDKGGQFLEMMLGLRKAPEDSRKTSGIKTSPTEMQPDNRRAQFEAEFAGLGEGQLGQIEREFAKRKKLLDDYLRDGVISTQEYNQTLEKLEQDSFSKRLNAYTGFANQALSVIGGMAQSLSRIFQMQDQQAQQSLDNMKAQGDAWIDYNEQQALAAAGIVKKTQSQQYAEELKDLQDKYNREINVIKKGDLAKQIQDKTAAQKEASIHEKAEQDKAAFDLLMDLRKRQMARQAFERNKEMQIVQATIQTIAGAVQVFMSAMSLPYPANLIAGAISAAAVTAFGLAEVGMIASQKAPAMETGGVVLGSQQGTLVTVGEKKKKEGILPLDDPSAMEMIRNALGINNAPTTVINVQGSVIDTQGLIKIVERHGNRQAQRMGARNIYQFAGI